MRHVATGSSSSLSHDSRNCWRAGVTLGLPRAGSRSKRTQNLTGLRCLAKPRYARGQQPAPCAGASEVASGTMIEHSAYTDKYGRWCHICLFFSSAFWPCMGDTNLQRCRCLCLRMRQRRHHMAVRTGCTVHRVQPSRAIDLQSTRTETESAPARVDHAVRIEMLLLHIDASAHLQSSHLSVRLCTRARPFMEASFLLTRCQHPTGLAASLNT